MKTSIAQRHYSQEALSYLYFFIRATGLDNLNRTWSYELYSIQVIYFSLFFGVGSVTINYVKYGSELPIVRLLSSLQLIIVMYVSFPKALLLYFSMGRLRRTAPIFDEMDVRIQSKEEETQAEMMVRNARRLVLIYVILYEFYLLCTFLFAIYQGHPPFSFYMPFCDWKESRKNLIIASFIEWILMSVPGLLGATLDSIAVVFIYVAIKHIEILCIRVRTLGFDPVKSKEQNLRGLADCVRIHIKFLQCLGNIRAVISKTLFVQFVPMVFVFATTLINILMFSNREDMIPSLVYLLSTVLQNFPICYLVNMLKDEIGVLPTSMFHCGWVDQCKEFRQMIPILIQHAQKEQSILAGNIIPVEIDTFVKIGKLSFSIYALMSEMAVRKGYI